jgi:hypothetical protein
MILAKCLRHILTFILVIIVNDYLIEFFLIYFNSRSGNFGGLLVIFGWIVYLVVLSKLYKIFFNFLSFGRSQKGRIDRNTQRE